METLQFNALTYMLKYDHSMIFKIPWDFRKEKKRVLSMDYFSSKNAQDSTNSDLQSFSLSST